MYVSFWFSSIFSFNLLVKIVISILYWKVTAELAWKYDGWLVTCFNTCQLTYQLLLINDLWVWFRHITFLSHSAGGVSRGSSLPF